jgi:hypothetical protein
MIKRRGFLTTLAAFFGSAPLLASGDVGDPELDAEVAEKPKPEIEPGDGGQIVSCKVGDVIELECHGIRCRAMVTAYDIRIMTHDIDITTNADLPFRRHLPTVTHAEIDLRLRSVGVFTVGH